MSDWGVPLGSKVISIASAAAAALTLRSNPVPTSSTRTSLAPGIYTRGELPQRAAAAAPVAVVAPIISRVKKQGVNDDLYNDGDDVNGEDEEEEGDGEEEMASKKLKRRKDAPAELPSTRGVSRFRQIIPVTRVQRRDPRFDASCGEFKEDLHDQSYAFVNDLRSSEVDELKAALKTTRDAGEAEKLKEELKKRSVAAKEAVRQKANRDTQRTQKHTAAAAVAAGGGAFFPKKRDLKQLEAVEQFKKLAASGKGAVERAIMKKRAKLSHKDKLALPRDMRGEEGRGGGGGF
jgi:ribosomal RNA-processing protein 36